MRNSLLISLFLLCASIAYGQTKLELSASTCTPSNTDTEWNFSNGCTITNDAGKGYNTGANGTIKYSRGVTFTIHLPEGCSANFVTISGYDNSLVPADAFLAQLGDATYTATDYLFPQKDGSFINKSYTIALANTANNTLSFKADGDQVCWIITLYDEIKECFELSANTHTTDWGFENGFSISNNNGKAYSTGSSPTVKYSAGVQYTIHIPDGVSIKTFAISGYDNSANSDAYLGELNGENLGTTYVFTKKNDDNAINKSYSIVFDNPVSGQLTFTATGQQVCLSIKLYTYEIIPGVSYTTPISQMEHLDRGLIVLPANSGSGQFVSWRLLGTENYSATTFDILRDGNVIASNLTGATSYIDTQGTTTSKYQIVTKHNGKVYDTTPQVTSWGQEYLMFNLVRPGDIYTPNDCSVGDVDGDGQYELFLKWDPSTSQDNSKDGKTDKVYIDCYKLDGTKLWRIDLGYNIRAGAHYTQFMVYDFDGDGKAEMICKTAPGSKDGTGAYVSTAATDNTIKNASDNATSYRNSNGHILSGPEYLTVFNGLSGKAIHTIWYNPDRGMNCNSHSASSYSSWGDNYGNRGERYLACVAYLDGSNNNPSAVMCRGYYSQAYLWAVDFDGAQLKHKWLHASTSKTNVDLYDANWSKTSFTYGNGTSGSGSGTMYANGNHNLSVADVDGDGCDEIIWGAGAVDNDGRLLYATGFGHGDAIHLADLNPDRPGLELFDVHEDKGTYSWDLHDAATGEIIFKGGNAGVDNGRGLAAQLEENHRGYYFCSSDERQQRSAVTGEVATTNQSSVNFRIYWDGDLQDELLDGHVNSATGYGDQVNLDNWNNGGASRLKTFQARATCNSTKATPNLVADFLGDWREELVLWSYDDPTKLYIYSTNIPTGYRVPTLMHDHVYRMGVAWQNVAYNQPPHVGYYLPDYVKYLTTLPMETPQPEIAIVDMKNIDLTGIYPSSSNTTYFLPVVDVTYDDSSVTPDVTAVFTDSEGTETILKDESTTFFTQDYEQATDASSWKTYANASLVTEDAVYGNYISFIQGGGSGVRSSYMNLTFSNGNIDDVDTYVVEFDLAFYHATNYNLDNEIILFGKGASMSALNSLLQSTNYVFKMSGGANYGTTYTVAGNAKSYILSDGQWYHYMISVKKTSGKVDYVISQGGSVIASDSYTITNSNVNLNMQGVWIGLGRANSYAYFDNLSIHTPVVKAFPYAFTEYGTLKVTASVEGSEDKTATFSAPLPYLLDPDNGDPEKFDTYIPVFVNDEKCERPLALADKANAHLWRSGITSNATWATMTLPFNMTKDQVKQAFGDDAVVANLVTSGGNNRSVLFETETGGVTANVPFMIKGVTKETPFLVRDVECAPVVNPVVSTTYFDFVGNYTYAGETIPFTTSDYFFLSDALHTVAQDGVKMTFYGYRAYFHSIYGHVGNALQVGFDTETAVCNIDTNTPDLGKVFSITGQRMKVDASGIHSLPKGIYIVNGKKVTVK